MSASKTADIESYRAANLRQLLLGASRTINRMIVAELQERGYDDLRATHTTLLSNIPLEGGSIRAAADRAGITPQAMGRLANDLAKSGYLCILPDPSDARVKRLELTRRGLLLMRESFRIMDEIEAQLARSIERGPFSTLKEALRVIAQTRS